MLLNLGLALLGVFLGTLLLLVHPLPALLVALAVALVDLLLFGELWMLGIQFNPISMVNLVVAVGLSADYSIHILHKYLSVGSATGAARMGLTMMEMGWPVL